MEHEDKPIWCARTKRVWYAARRQGDIMFYKSYCIRGNRAAYRAIFKYKDDDGRWHQISRTLQAATKRDAQREAKELHMKLEDEADLFRLRRSCAATVSSFLSAYVDRIEESRSVERTTINGIAPS